MTIKKLKCGECHSILFEVLFNDETKTFLTKCPVCGLYTDNVGLGD